MNIEMLRLRIEKRIDNNYDIVQLRKKLLSYHSFDLAKAFNKMDKKYQHRIYEILSPEEFSRIFSYLDEDSKFEIKEDLHKEYFALVISYLPVDEACDILKKIDNRKELLKMMPRKKAIVIESLIKYNDDQAGSVMSTEFIKINSNMDVKDAMRILRENCNMEVIDKLFVLDDNEKLVGIVDLNDLIISRSPCKIEDIMDEPITIDASDNILNAIEIIKKYDLKALAVVDNDKMKGIIAVDDWFDFMQEEVMHDYNMMAGISFDKSKKNLISNVKKRLPWLVVLMLLSLIVSVIISAFDRIIAEVSVLVVFQSLILGMGGNSGTQSLAVAVRNISANRVSSISKYLLKETKIGLINGFFLGAVAFLVSYLFLLLRYPNTSIIISIIVGISLLFAIMISTLIGALTPILFNKIKVDPAVASGPFISTINDCICVTIYYSLAMLLIGLVGWFICCLK